MTSLGLRFKASLPQWAPSDGALGLRYFAVAVPDTGELQRLSDRLAQADIPIERTETGVLARDPSRNGVLLTDRS
jgi:hypothetical protein